MTSSVDDAKQAIEVVTVTAEQVELAVRPNG